MNLNDLITSYVDFRRTLGEKCLTNEAVRRSFCHAVGQQTQVKCIRANQVKAFLAGTGPITNARHVKYSALNGFFQFAVSRGHLHHVPLPKQLPKRCPTLVPYIYSREELCRLLDAIPSFPHFPKRIEPPTIRAILRVFSIISDKMAVTQASKCRKFRAKDSWPRRALPCLVPGSTLQTPPRVLPSQKICHQRRSFDAVATSSVALVRTVSSPKFGYVPQVAVSR